MTKPNSPMPVTGLNPVNTKQKLTTIPAPQIHPIGAAVGGARQTSKASRSPAVSGARRSGGSRSGPKREVDVATRIKSRWAKLCSVAVPALQRHKHNSKERKTMNAQNLAVACRRKAKKRKAQVRGRNSALPKNSKVVRWVAGPNPESYYMSAPHGDEAKLWPLCKLGCFEVNLSCVWPLWLICVCTLSCSGPVSASV